MIMKSYTLPAGIYWIGDPCYIFPNDGPLSDYWDKVLCVPGFPDIDHHVKVGPVELWCAPTYYGDGGYYSGDFGDGFEFAVDSGTIGIVPLETVSFLNGPDTNPELGFIVEFEEEFQVIFDNGTFIFGGKEIDTRCLNEEIYEYE